MISLKTSTLVFLTFLYSSILWAQQEPVEIMIVGSDHLSNLYKEGYPNTDALSTENQKLLEDFSAMISDFKPDMVGIETLPKDQQEVDSLYQLYVKNKLDVSQLQYPRSEKYQIAFRVGEKNKLHHITCVNYKGGTSQSILDNGDNIEIYEDKTKKLHQKVGEVYGALRSGKMNLKEFLILLNQPEIYNLVYQLRYMTPARVTNGTFTNPDEMVDNEFVDPKYIGAELISVFKNRDYKIYSNIVTNQLQHNYRRILIIIGAGHIGSLKSIFRDDPEFELVDTNTYLKPKMIK